MDKKALLELKSQYTEKGKYLIDVYIYYLSLKKDMSSLIESKETYRYKVRELEKVRVLYLYILNQMGMSRSKIARILNMVEPRISSLYVKGREIAATDPHFPHNPYVVRRLQTVNYDIEFPFINEKAIKKEMQEVKSLALRLNNMHGVIEDE